MNLGGIVWTEKIKTDKTTAEINNQYDGEKTDEALAGIKVNLYKHGKKLQIQLHQMEIKRQYTRIIREIK